MLLHLIFPEKSLLAKTTLIGLHTTVSHPMTMHVSLLTELHFTDIALVHLALVSFMRFQVAFHVLRHTSREIAVRTHVYYLLSFGTRASLRKCVCDFCYRDGLAEFVRFRTGRWI